MKGQSIARFLGWQASLSTQCPLNRLRKAPNIAWLPAPGVRSASSFKRRQQKPSTSKPSNLPAQVSPSLPPSTADPVPQNDQPKIVSLFADMPPAEVKEVFRMKTYKPRTPGLRHLKRPISPHLYRGGPFLPLTFARKGQGIGGRNHTGKVTVRHRGGGHKRRIRMVDFHRSAPGPHTVIRIERDPGRSAHIALVRSEETKKLSYILAAEGMRAGDVLRSYRAGIPEELLAAMGGVVDTGVLAARTAWRGNCLPLHMIPSGTVIHNIGSHGTGPGVFCRSAGTYGSIVSSDGKYVRVRMQSGEIRRVVRDACATIGTASNGTWMHRQLGKAGRSRWLGIRPTVRGMAMNAVEHPHGGGRGKSKGNRHPMSPWGVPTKSGYKTRPKWKPNKWLIKDRPRMSKAKLARLKK